MSSHAKAASARSNDGHGGSRSFIDRAFAVRGALRGGKGSGAPSGRATSISLLAGLSLLVALFVAPAALAAPPAVTIDPASGVGFTTAKVKGTVNPNGVETNYRFEYITDAAYQAVVDEKQAIYDFLSEGAFVLSFKGQPTAPIPYNATAGQVESALNALSTIGGAGGSVAVTGGPKPYKVTFGGAFAGTNVDQLVFVSPDFSGYTETTQDGHAIGFGGASTAGGGTLGAGAGLTSVPGPDPLLLEGLTASTTYHLRLVAENADGTQSATATNFTTAAATAPTATTAPATLVSYTSARISGTIDPNGGNTNPDGSVVPIEWNLQYSADPVGEGWASAGTGVLTGAEATSTDPVAVPPSSATEANAVNLKGGTKYFFRLVVTYAGKSAQSAEPNPEFTTLAVELPEAVSINPATDVLESSAHLSGKVKRPANTDPAFDVNCRFEYVSDAQFLVNGYTEATARACEPDVTKTVGEKDVTADLGKAYYGDNSLTPNTKYHLRLTVSNAGGSDSVEAPTFTTLPAPGPPAVTINPATAITGRSANFSGTINPGGTDMSRSLSWHFECTPECPPLPGKSLNGDLAPTNSPQAVQGTARLKANTAYQVKLVANRVTGVEGSAGPLSFSTPAIIGAVTGSANVTATTASISGQVDPGGAATSYHFDYGTTAAYGQSTPAFSLPASDEKASITEALAELAPGTTYHYRLVASNSSGTANGADKSFTTSGSAAAACPNAAVREQQKAGYLPECRAYEIVNNPSDEIGDIVRAPLISADGNHSGFVTVTPGNEAAANATQSHMTGNRTSTGWVQINPNLRPVHPVVGSREDQALYAYSPDFSRSLIATGVAGNPEEGYFQTQDIYRKQVGTELPPTWLTRTKPGTGGNFQTLIAVSPDLGRIYYTFANNGAAEDNQIFTTTDGTDTEVVSILPNGEPSPYATAAGYQTAGLFSSLEPHGGSRPLSDDGRRLFFYSGTLATPNFLYMRDLVKKETIAVSASQRTGEVGSVKPVNFLAASHSGEVVYFSSDARLTDSTPVGGGIYRFNVVSKALDVIAPAGPPQNQFESFSVASPRLSDDDSHLYFMSTQGLAPGGEVGVSSVYVWSGGSVQFVAPGGLKGVSRNGRYAVLLANQSVDGAPNNGRDAVYLYDDVTKDVACASCRPDGFPSQANSTTLAAPSGGIVASFPASRNVTDDGRVFFNTRDQLVEADLTSSQDVYMYSKGAVSLISAGNTDSDSFLAENTDDGNNVFILTRSPLVAQDVDANELDVYDVRVNGGFLNPPPPATPCQGEACRGATSKAPAAEAPVTPNFIGAGNKQSGRNQGKKHHKKKHHKKKHHKKKHHKKKHHKKKQKKGKGKQKRAANSNGRTGR